MFMKLKPGMGNRVKPLKPLLNGVSVTKDPLAFRKYEKG
jgi:hypothetical protein